MKKKIDYDWINTPPPVVEQNDDGSEFIPIGHIEAGLTRLDSHWGDENFKFQLLVGKSGIMWADGSLELVITYGGKTRRLVGAATMIIPADTDFENPSVNSNFGPTVKAECRKNASKGIGLYFGAGLNDRLTINTPQQNKPVNGRKKPDPVEMLPDKSMQDSFNKAVESCNEKAMKAIRITYPSIQYTGTSKIIQNA